MQSVNQRSSVRMVLNTKIRNGIYSFVYYSYLVILIGVTLVQVGQCLYKFIQEPTFVSSSFVDQKNTDFPSLTVCLDSNIKVSTLNYINISIE
jgi:hypothetical protein